MLLACLVCVIKILTLSLHKWFLNAAVVSLIITYVCMILSMCTVIMNTRIQLSSTSVNVTSVLCCLHELIAKSLFFLCKSSGDQCYTISRYMRIRNKIFGNYFYYLLYKNLGHDTLWALYLLTSRKLIGTQRKGVMAQTPLYQNHGNSNGWMVIYQVTTTLMMPYCDSRLNEYCVPTIIELTLTSDQWSVLAWICKVLTWKPIELQLQPLDMIKFITKQ